MTQKLENSLEAAVRQQYNQMATHYDRRWQDYINRTLLFFKDWANIHPDETVLDVACGTGALEYLLLTQHPQQQIVGIDLSGAMLAQARQKLEGFATVVFQEATVRSLPFAKSHFDVVMSANSFHYFDNPDGCLREMRRVLHPQGRLVLLDWCRDHWLCQVCDVVLQWFDPAHRQCYTQAELHALLQAAQFQIVRSERVRLTWLWEVMVVEARRLD